MLFRKIVYYFLSLRQNYPNEICLECAQDILTGEYTPLEHALIRQFLDTLLEYFLNSLLASVIVILF